MHHGNNAESHALPPDDTASDEESLESLRIKNEELKKAVDLYDAAAKESNHRIKNALQMVSSLLRLQSARLKDSPAIHAIKQASTRVDAIAQLHGKVYILNWEEQLDISLYIGEICDLLRIIFDSDDKHISLNVEIESLTVSAKIAQPIALIVNELVTNSYAHAFPDNRTGNIFVKGKKKGEQFVFAVYDDGIGFPADFKIQDSSRTVGNKLGHKIIVMMSSQIDSKVYNDPGKPYFEFSFPIAQN